MLFNQTKPEPPDYNYSVKGKHYRYRSTATAMARREGVTTLKNDNGFTYSLNEVENAMISHPQR